MFAVPPPSSGLGALVDTLKTIVFVIVWSAIAFLNTVFGSSRIACVIVPAAMKADRSCGSLGVSVLVAV
jgi:hypothetical protein